MISSFIQELERIDRSERTTSISLRTFLAKTSLGVP
jgi:hypothetical protein